LLGDFGIHPAAPAIPNLIVPGIKLIRWLVPKDRVSISACDILDERCGNEA
jgi:hypothetical protein